MTASWTSLTQVLFSFSAVRTFAALTDTFLKQKQQITHTCPFNGPLSGTTQVGQYQKSKTNLDFTEARDSQWQQHQLGYASLHLTPGR